MTRIVERMMRAGTFSLDMKGTGTIGGTPKSVIDQLRAACGQNPDGSFIPTDGHIIVTPGRIDPSVVSADLAIWQGRLTKSTGARTFAGHGMSGWLGKPTGTSPFQFYRISDLATLTEWVDLIVLNGITKGTITEPGGTHETPWRFSSPIEQLDAVCEALGAEWVVHPNGVLDAGPVGSIYPTEPTIVFVGATTGGVSGDIRPIRATLLAPTVDSDHRATRTWVAGAERPGTHAAFYVGVTTPDATVAYDHTGAVAELERVVNAPEYETDATADVLAATVQGRWLDPQTSVEVALSGDRWRQFVNPGELAWMWYPAAGIVDVDTPVIEIDGDPMMPRQVRVQQVEWSPSEGDGVYLFRKDMEPLDLSDWVVTGSGGRVLVGTGNGEADLATSTTGTARYGASGDLADRDSTSISGVTTVTPNASGQATISYGKTFASPPNLQCTLQVSTGVQRQAHPITVGTSSFTVVITENDALSTTGSFIVHWRAEDR